MPQESRLPAGVREKHGSWHLVRNHVWTKLCRITEGRARLYERLFEVAPGLPGSCWHAILSYLKYGMGGLADATQKHYRNDALRLLHHFGHYEMLEVEPTHIAQYLKWCRENDRATTGNREKAVFSSIFEYAMAEGWCPANPCRGVRRNKERPSKKYVEHPVLATELDRSPPWLLPLFAIAYLLGIRQTDLRLVTKAAISPEGLKITESKTKKENTHEITPTVREFLHRAFSHQEAAAARHETAAARLEALSQFRRAAARREKAAVVRAQPYIFLSERGLPWTENGLQSALRRFDAPFQFRQLRPKAQTDSPDKNILGHTGQMREAYTRRRQLRAVK